MAHQDLTGTRFGKLVVTALAPERTPSGRYKWLVRCDCGAEKSVQAMSLKNGDTASCGCTHREQLGNRKRKHGLSETSEYRSWCAMINRCTNPRGEDFDRYGGRGIKVCERWRDFRNFIADMGMKPAPGFSIEREDNDGDYEPSNCRWATQSEQVRNTSRNVIAPSGRVIADEAPILGIKSSVIYQRVKLGWSIEEAISTPVGPMGWKRAR